MFRTSRYELDEQSFALGFATNSPYNLQGFHSPNLLVVITEVHAAREPDLDAVRRLNPTRLLMTGNPFIRAGTFFDSHHSKREMYETVQIGAADTPNIREQRVVVIPGMITQQDIEDRKEDWGEDSALYIGAVLGEFPENMDEIVVPLVHATQAARPSTGAGGASGPGLRRGAVWARQDGGRPAAGVCRTHRLAGQGLRHDEDCRVPEDLLPTKRR